MIMKKYDNRPIGVFDSGLGGLTILTELARLLPEERFVYFGDTARTPYGSKAIGTIQRFTIQIAEFLVAHDVKALVIACNTISATCLDILKAQFPQLPIIGVIAPTAKKVAEDYCNDQRIGIIGTKVTISSNKYEEKILDFNNNCNVFSKACPLFVPAIEEGLNDTKLMENIVQHYIDDFVKTFSLDVLVLGCTHYPLVEKTIKKLYPELKIINPCKIVAQEVNLLLEEKKLKAHDSRIENHLYASDLSETFLKMARDIELSSKAVIKLKKFDEHTEKILTKDI